MSDFDKYEPGFYYALPINGSREETIVRVTKEKRLVDTISMTADWSNYEILGPVPSSDEAHALQGREFNPCADQTP